MVSTHFEITSTRVACNTIKYTYIVTVWHTHSHIIPRRRENQHQTKQPTHARLWSSLELSTLVTENCQPHSSRRNRTLLLLDSSTEFLLIVTSSNWARLLKLSQYKHNSLSSKQCEDTTHVRRVYITQRREFVCQPVSTCQNVFSKNVKWTWNQARLRLRKPVLVFDLE